jgi:hypothetical protein
MLSSSSLWAALRICGDPREAQSPDTIGEGQDDEEKADSWSGPLRDGVDASSNLMFGVHTADIDRIVARTVALYRRRRMG